MDISEMLTSLNLDKNNLKLKAELKSFLDSQNVDSLLDFVNSSNLNIQIIALERLISLNSILSTIDLSIYFKSLSTFHKSVYPLLLCFINSHSKNTKHANELAAALDSENISLLLSNEENFQLGLDLLSNTVCNCEKITATVCISIIEIFNEKINSQTSGQFKRLILSSLLKMISSNKKFTTQFLNSADLSDFFGLVSNKVLKPIIPLLLVSLFQQTETLQETLSTLIQNWQALDDRSAHIKSLLLLSAVFQSKPAAGSAIFLKEGIIDNLIELLEFSKPDVQVAALEVLSISCSDKLSRNLVCAKCTPLLQILSKSDNSDVKSGAISTLIKSMIDDKETEKKVLQDVGIIDNLILNVQSSLNGGLGHDIESLAFLSVQPEIKEKMVGDQKFLVSLFQYNSNDRTILFGISTILFNLTRFSKKLTEEEEQIQKLRQMTKDIPKVSSDERNSDNAVFIRCSKLIKSGIVPFLVYLSKSDSINIKDTVAQIFHSLVSKPENRGVIIQQGGVKSLIQLSSNCSNEFIPLATQSLAKITITADPNIAFKGETVNELIRPFISLLNGDDQLRQFEGLMALTNLASIGPQVRQLIIKNQGVKAFEMLQFSSNEMVQRAATEAMCNMMFEQQVFESFSNASTSSRLLIFIALCGSEDLATRRAASGVVAILSSDENACRLIQKEEKGLPILAELLEDDSIEILHRALECVKNMVLFGGEVKRAVVLSGCIEIVRKMKTNVDILIGLKKEILDSV